MSVKATLRDLVSLKVAFTDLPPGQVSVDRDHGLRYSRPEGEVVNDAFRTLGVLNASFTTFESERDPLTCPSMNQSGQRC